MTVFQPVEFFSSVSPCEFLHPLGCERVCFFVRTSDHYCLASAVKENAFYGMCECEVDLTQNHCSRRDTHLNSEFNQEKWELTAIE